ncbi:MAG: SDR family NAD(P)-dependent oxidoreductase [Solirubrobacterales bacterium]
MKPIEIASRLMNMPIGVAGRLRPFYLLELADAVRSSSSLEDAISGRTVVVTGASSGIGEATTRLLAGAGAEVARIARRRDELERIAEEIAEAGGTAHVHPCDLADADAAEAVGAEIVERHGGVDVLVNNAGRSIRRSIHLSYDRAHDFERTIQLNYLGAVRMTLAFLPSMRERGDGQIINVSSTGVQARVPRFSAYVASKAALDAFADCIQGEIADEGIRVTTIHMPLVRTPMIASTEALRAMPSISSEQAAERVAQAVVHRPMRIGTPYSEVAGIFNSVSPASMSAARNAGFRRTSESQAAREDETPESPE